MPSSTDRTNLPTDTSWDWMTSFGARRARAGGASKGLQLGEALRGEAGTGSQPCEVPAAAGQGSCSGGDTSTRQPDGRCGPEGQGSGETEAMAVDRFQDGRTAEGSSARCSTSPRSAGGKTRRQGPALDSSGAPTPVAAPPPPKSTPSMAPTTTKTSTAASSSGPAPSPEPDYHETDPSENNLAQPASASAETVELRRSLYGLVTAPYQAVTLGSSPRVREDP